jgi:Domain of unknown function (DUF4173)
MEKSIMATIAVFVGACLFNYLFWFDKQGVNVLLFDIFCISVLFYLNAESFQKREVQVLVGGTLLAATLIVLHNSLIVRFIHTLSFMTMVGMVQMRELRFLAAALFLTITNFVTAPLQIVRNTFNTFVRSDSLSGIRHLQHLALTVFVVPIFFLIYYNANPHFASLADAFFDRFFSWFTLDIDFGRIVFFGLGLCILSAIVWNSVGTKILSIEKMFGFDLKNTSKTTENAENTEGGIADNSNPLSFQTGYRNALYLLIVLNLMTFFNNVLDIQHVWLDTTERSALDMKMYVHEGTYILIYGILLAVGLTLWLFRGQLNFMENSKILRGVAVAWLVQNAILAISVGVRNWRYIDQYGLAYKRIGVFVFLGLVMGGLWVLYFKIRDKRTFFYFITRSSWVIYGGLMLTCLVNWDIFITRYNLSTTSKSGVIDARFLLREVSDKNLYLLYQNKDYLMTKLPKEPFPEQDNEGREMLNLEGIDAQKAYFSQRLDCKKKRFLEEQSQYSWLSWNYPDYVNKQFFK